MMTALETHVRRAFLLALVAAGAAWANGEYSLTPDSATLQRGGTVTLTASVSGNTGFSVSMNFTYDPNVLEFTSAAWTAAGEAAKNPVTQNPLHLAVLNRVGLVFQGTSAFNGNLATLVFQVKADAALGANDNAIVYAGGNHTTTAGLPITLTIVKLFNAGDPALTVDEDAGWTEVDFTGALTDQAGNPVAATVTAVTQPTSGQAKLDGGKVYYKPNTDYNGDDQFTYTADDGANPTDDGTINVTVTPVNDIPQLQTTANSDEGAWHKYTEGDGAVNVFTAVTVVDPDFSDDTPQANYNGAKFYAVIENAQTGDTLSYDAAVRSSDITLNGARIIYQATEIGDLFQIAGGIRINLDDARADITPTMIQALVNDLKFENPSDAPSDAERLVRVFLDDAPGDEPISHHLFGVDAFLGVDTRATRATLTFMAVELQVDSSVRSITIFGNNSATGTTVDQYGVITGDNTTGDSWYNFNQGWGRAEWDVELEFASWADMIAAFPAGAPLRIQLNYWDVDDTPSVIDLALTGLPATAPSAPVATITTPGDDQIQFGWANNTGDPAAGALFVEIEGPEIYNLAEDEFETAKTGGLWDDTTHTFTGLGTGEYWAEIFVGNLLVEGNVSSVPVELAWATGTYQIVPVGTTFEASGTITDNSRAIADADALEVQVNIVTTGGQWEYYVSTEEEFTGSGPWDYTFNLPTVPAGYTHYVIQAYIDRNQNGMAALGEPVGQSANVTTAGNTYHISLTPQPRSWTRDWSLLGAAYLYVAPVNDPPVNTLRPEITGTAQYGQTLTTTNGTWNDTLDAAPAPAVFTYQWYGTAGALAGEDKQTLDTDNYVGLDIYVQVTATDSGVGQAAVRATASATADSQWVRINKAAQTITFGALANKTFGDADFDLAATASSTLAVSYASSDDTIASIAGATVTIHKAGTVTITASQAGDGNYSPAADAQQDLTIDKADQTITFGALAGKTYGDADFDLAATADSTLAVSYASSDDTVASIAGATVTIHKAGTVTITASQAGNGNYNAAADVPQVLNVAKVALVVAANAGQSKTYGDAEPALFTYTITTGALVGGDTLTGALSRVAGEDVANYAIQQNDLAASANYTLTYVGANFAVTKADQTITFGALPGKTYGDPTFDLAARADSTLPVSYDSSNPAVATVAGSTVTIHGAGATTITASQAGNGNYNAAADVPQVLNVAKVDLVVTANAGQSKAYGDPEPAEFTYTITTGALVGGDTLSGALNRVAGENVANYAIQQNDLAASANYTLAYVGANFAVTKADQTITFGPLPGKTYGDADFALTATASSTLAVSYASSDPTVASVAGATVTIHKAGSTTVTASQAGDGNYNAAADVPQVLNVAKMALQVTADAGQTKAFGAAEPAQFTYTITIGALVGADTLTGALSRVAGEDVGDYAIQQNDLAASANYTLAYVGDDFTITKADQTITFGALANKTFGDAAFGLTATASSTLAVSYASSDDTIASIAGATVTIHKGGTVTITASQAGNGNYNPAVDVDQTLTIDKADQTIAFGALANKTYGDADFALGATADSTLAVTYASSDPTIASVAGNTVTIHKAGTVTITASQAGDGNYNPAVDVDQAVTIDKAALTIKADNANRSYFSLNSAIPYAATFTGLTGGDVAGDFDGQLTFSTDASDGGVRALAKSPHDVNYETRVVASAPAALPAANYALSYQVGVLDITDNAPTRNEDGTFNSLANPLVVVSGRDTTFDLNDFFDDADKALGDALVFSGLSAVTGGTNATIAFAPVRADGSVTFDPVDTIQGDGDPVAVSFTVDVVDSANPALGPPAEARTQVTIYLEVIDNQGPEVTAATPADEDGDLSEDDVEQIAINEGDTVQVSVTATDENDPSGDDGIASIHFAYSWDGTNWTPLDPPVRAGEASATSAILATDMNTVSAAEDTKDLQVKAIITDGAAVVTNKEWLFTVTNVNVQPTLADIADVNVKEDNLDGDSLTVQLTATNGGETNDPAIAGDEVRGRLLPGARVAASSSDTDIATIESIIEQRGTFLLTYGLKPDANGTVTVTVTVNDGTGADNATVEKTFDIAVSAVNDAPSSVTGGNVIVDEDSGAYSQAWATSVSPGPADEAAQPVQFSVTGNTNSALFSTPPAVAADGRLTFTPAEDANGAATITVVLADNDAIPARAPAQSAPIDFTITVTARNDRPTFTGGGDVTVAEDSGAYDQPWASAIVVGPADENGQTPTFTAVVTLNAALFAVPPAVSANGQLSFTPTDDAFGSATVSVTLADGGAAEDLRRGADHGNTSDPAVFTINVTPVNDAPVITTDPVVFAVDEDDPDGTSVATLAATDTEGDTRNWTIESNPNFSIGLLTGDIEVKVGAALDHEDADSHQLLVTVTDDGTPAEDDTVTVTINVGDVNEAPVAAADYATAKQGEVVVVSVLANDADPDDGDALDVSSVTIVGPVTGGIATPEADGTVTFEPTPGFTGTATFTYTVDDGFGVTSNVATVDVVVGSPPWFPLFPIPDPPARAIVSFVRVRVANGAGDTQLTAVLPIDDAIGELIFRPEDYMTGEGAATAGLLPGTYTPYFAYWVEGDGDFGEEQEGNSFVVSYEEPAAPTGVDVRDPSGPLAAPVPGGARFAFQLPTTQGYVLEVDDGNARAVVTRLVRPLARPAEGEAFPVALAVSDLFIPLIPGDYSWRVRGYNPLAPADPITRAEAWSDGNPFTVTAPAPAGAPVAPDLLSPGDGLAFNPNAATGKAMVDFFWTAVPGATGYYLYVGLQEGTAVVNNELTGEPALAGVSLRPGTYRWAAMAFNEAGRSAWSVVGEFTVNPAPGLALVTGAYADPNIVFDWIGIAPQGVELYIVDEGAYRAWMVPDLPPDQPYTPSGELALPGHTYWFRARSIGANGDRGVWSDWGVYQIPEAGDQVLVAATPDTTVAGQVTFAWIWANMPAGAQVKIRVLRASNLVSGVWTDATGTDDLVLAGEAVAAPGETYHYQIRPLDADGNPLNGWTDWLLYTMPGPK